MANWPIVARTTVVDALVDGLARRPARSQLLRGPSGVGKTTVAAAAAAALAARGRTVVPVVALAELTAVPLGALAPLLASSSAAPPAEASATTATPAAGGVADRLAELVALVGRRADAYVIVVDDAPLLDEASAAALYQLVRVFGVPALLTARDEHPVRGAVARLLHEDLVDVTDLNGLSLDEVRTVLRRRLGAEPRPESLQRLYATTAGNPLFLRELTLAAERSDGVRPGPFGLEIEAARLPAHVVETVAGRLAELGPAHRQIAELIAVAQPWPRAVLTPTEHPIVDDLVESGVVVPAAGPTAGFVHLAHPVYAEALLAALRADERAARRRAAAERLLALDDEALRFTGICLLADAGGQVAPVDLVTAAEYAHRAGDHARALSAAEAALAACGSAATDSGARVDPERHPAQSALADVAAHAALVSASALSALGGDPAQTEAAFVRAAQRAVDAEGRARVEVRWGQHTALREVDPARAARRATALLPELGAAAALLTGDLAKWRLMAGDAGALDTPFAPHDDSDPGAALNSAIGMAMMATMAGRVAEARAAVDAGRPLADRFAAVQPFAGGLLDLSAFLVLVAEGDIAAARDHAEQRRLEPFSDAAGVWSYALAIVELHAGRPDEALPLALLAVDQLRWRDFTGLLGPAIALAATARAQRGETDQALALLAELQPAQRDDVKVVLQEAEARAWLAIVADDDADAAVGMLLPAVQRGVELGHLLLATLTASVAVRLGGATAVRPLLEAAAAASAAPLLVRAAQLAAALDDRDPARVVAMVDEVVAAGLVATAHAALEATATMAGDDRMLERRARVRAAELGLAVTRVRSIRSSRKETGLTEREWIIAQAAARRERSREIAERLGVSVRTVDNHLASVYRKLGISGRAELEAELREQS